MSGLGTFLDLRYFIRHQTMRLVMDGLRRFLIRSFDKAEDLAALLVEPVQLSALLALSLYLRRNEFPS